MDRFPERHERRPLGAVRRFLADEQCRVLSDDALWARFRDRADMDALGVLLERARGRLTARGHHVTGDAALAEDAVHNAFLTLVKHREKYGTYDRAEVVLNLVTASSALMLLRQRWRATQRDKRAARPEVVTDRPPADSASLTAAVAGLPARERQAVELVFLAGLTHEAAAAAMGMGRGSVGKYVGRGLRRLRTRLGPAGYTTALVVSGLAPDRAVALTALALAGGVPLRWLPAKLAAAAVGVGLAAGGVGWVATRVAAPVAVAARPPAVPESLQARTLRLFAADVREPLLVALGPLAGAGGEVRLERLDAFDTRADATLTVRHGPAGGPVSRVRLLADADTRHTQAFLHAAGRDRSERLLQPTAGVPTVVLRPWDGGPRLELPVPGLTAALATFDSLPRDARTAAEGDRFRAALAAQLAGRWGGWRHCGDPTRVYQLEWRPGDDRPRLAAPPGAGWSLADGRTWYRIEPDGPAGSRLLFEDEPAEWGDAGRRLTLRNGDWWDRPAD